MEIDIKRMFERQATDSLLAALDFTVAFERWGNDRDEPDVIYRYGNGARLGIEVCSVYYNDHEAKLDWLFRKRTQLSFVDEVPTEPNVIFGNEMDVFARKINQEIQDKCAKHYVGVDYLWLCIEENNPTTNEKTIYHYKRCLLLPTENDFERIYLLHPATGIRPIAVGELSAVKLY